MSADNIQAALARIDELHSEAVTNLSAMESGNKTAQTRLRKNMQEIKEKAQEIRNSVIEFRDSQK